MTLSAIHMKTRGFKCDVCPEVIKRALKGVPGVRDAVAVPSLRITSVLYDSERVEVGQLRERMERCGYEIETRPVTQ